MRFQVVVRKTDEASKVTEQTKIPISHFLSVMVGASKEKRKWRTHK